VALFALICTDKPDVLGIRKATRESHIEYLKGFPDALLMAGPFLDEAGEMCGSLLIFEAPDLAVARAFSDNDPYAKAGMFASVEIRGFRAGVGKLL
jgi:uncharacterized protein